MHAEARPAELAREQRRGRETLRAGRAGAAQFAGDDEITGAQARCEATGHADERDGRLLIEPGGELCACAPSTLSARADDNVCTADGERLDTEGCDDLELSRGGLRSSIAPAP